MAVALPIARYDDLIRRIRALGVRVGVPINLGTLRRSGYALPFFSLTSGPPQTTRICLTAGIHGDEPAGVEALLEFVELSFAQNRPLHITALPCMNPTGYAARTRRNDMGYDLNRTFGQDVAPLETQLVREALANQRFDMLIDLHEDTDGEGFYLYEHVRCGAAVGPHVIARVRAAGFPIQAGAHIEGRALRDGCVEPGNERPSATNGYFSIFAFDKYADRTIVPETPAAAPLGMRVAMHLAAIEAATESLRKLR